MLLIQKCVQMRYINFIGIQPVLGCTLLGRYSKKTSSLQRQQKARWKRHGVTSKAAKCNIEKAWHRSKAANQVCVIAGVVHGTSWELEKVRGNGVMAMLTLAIISVVAALQVFGKDRLIFWRESESGESCCSQLACSGVGDICILLQVACPCLQQCCLANASLVAIGQSAGQSAGLGICSCVACPQQTQLYACTCACNSTT